MQSESNINYSEIFFKVAMEYFKQKKSTKGAISLEKPNYENDSPLLTKSRSIIYQEID